MDPSEVTPRRRPPKSAMAQRQRRTIRFAVMRIVVSVVVLLGGYLVLPFDRVSATQLWLVVLAGVIALTVVSIAQLRAVADAEFPLMRGIEALVVSLVLLLVTFAGIYLGLSSDDAGAFDESLGHVPALYFALTTLTTIGYGDIAPVSDTARVVVMVQMVVDVVVIGVFIKLVASAVKKRLSANQIDPVDPDGSPSVG